MADEYSRDVSDIYDDVFVDDNWDRTLDIRDMRYFIRENAIEACMNSFFNFKISSYHCFMSFYMVPTPNRPWISLVFHVS